MHPRCRQLGRFAAAMALALASQGASASPLLDRLIERRAQAANGAADAASSPARLPPETRLVRDFPYGDDAEQRFDVYAPAHAAGAPVIVMVHGGAWAIGDKSARSVVDNKVARWVPRGFIVVSANYRLLPKAAPLAQAGDVARALAAVQAKAAAWGGDGKRVVLMGHSAGAHLAALLAAAPTLAGEAGAAPWLGTVLLDSAALDLEQLMAGRHARLYDRAFGADPRDWRAASPFRALAAGAAPILAVCSTTRRDVPCGQARQFAARAGALGIRAEVLEQALAHGEINERLGSAGEYTAAVESFLAGLDPLLAQRLAAPADPAPAAGPSRPAR